MAELKYFLGTGRRKTSVARVFLKEKGKGSFVINNKKIEDYFGRAVDRKICFQPLALLGLEEKYDVMVNVFGGGLSGQSGAIRHGLTRALIEVSAEWKPQLRAAGYVTRDSRVVERKKVGLHKARKALQYSKR